MNLSDIKDKALPLLRLYWLSFILLFCSWFIIKQHYMAIEYNIFLAVDYKHVGWFSWIYFLIDNFLLIVHEAGHSIFGIFGWRFLTVLGGTLLQILLPFIIFAACWRAGSLYGAQFMLYITGFGWLSASGYAADAYEQKLPLIGNLPKSAHDYLNLLSDLNILNHYKTVAWIMFSIGVLVLIATLLLPLLHSRKSEYVSLDLKI